MPSPPRPAFDRAQIDHIAELASLSLSDREAEALGADVEAILRYVDELSSLDTESVPPTTSVQLDAAAWREDEVLPGVTHEEALAQAPRTAHGGFAVPAFVENG